MWCLATQRFARLWFRNICLFNISLFRGRTRVPFPVCAAECPLVPWGGRWSARGRSSWLRVWWRQAATRAHRPGNGPPSGQGIPAKARRKYWCDTAERVEGCFRLFTTEPFRCTERPLWDISDLPTQWFDVFLAGGSGTGISTVTGEDTRRGAESLSSMGSLLSTLSVSSGMTSHLGGLTSGLLAISPA